MTTSNTIGNRSIMGRADVAGSAGGPGHYCLGLRFRGTLPGASTSRVSTSIALIVWRVTPIRSASSCCVISPVAKRSSRIRFLTAFPILEATIAAGGGTADCQGDTWQIVVVDGTGRVPPFVQHMLVLLPAVLHVTVFSSEYR
jgi:hypothetical protein